MDHRRLEPAFRNDVDRVDPACSGKPSAWSTGIRADSGCGCCGWYLRRLDGRQDRNPVWAGEDSAMGAYGFGTVFLTHRDSTQCMGFGAGAFVDGLFRDYLEHRFGRLSSAEDPKCFAGSSEQYVPIDGLGDDAGGYVAIRPGGAGGRDICSTRNRATSSLPAS